MHVMAGSAAASGLGVNLGFVKFLFVTPRAAGEETVSKLRAVAASIARGYINDFERDGSRETAGGDSIQFFTSTCPPGATCARARYVVQIASRYRPRLDETEAEMRRRLAGLATVEALDGAARAPQYTSAEMHAYAFKQASGRVPARRKPTTIIIPLSKTTEWWAQSALERHAYFYPHADPTTGAIVDGHARVAGAGIGIVHRRLYYNPDGHGRPGEYDFITYFECPEEHVGVFDEICRRLRDVALNPEWRFVVEGPEWRGTPVLRW